MNLPASVYTILYASLFVDYIFEDRKRWETMIHNECRYLRLATNRYLVRARRQRIKPLIWNDNAYEKRDRSIILLELMVFESNGSSH